MAADELRLESRGIDGSTSSVGGGSPNAWREIILIFGLFFLFAGSPPPDVNEAHYLAKAKHYWDSSWCGPDLFLDSADAHPVFYWLFGWMTLCCSLTTVTWLGRVVTWTLLAVGWQRLSWSVVPQRYASVATATMFVVLCDRCHLAGEWAVGGLEAKGLAYALVLFGLRAIVLERWQAVWMWMGAATAVHVLVGGWSLLAGGICWWFSGNRRPPLGTMRGGLALGACCALVGLVPAIRLMLGADPDMAREASGIYVFGRLAHHLVFHHFALVRIISFGALLLAWVGLWWYDRDLDNWRRLHRFAGAALLFSALGMVIDISCLTRPLLAAQLLKFYWFRLADIAVPMVVALGIAVAAHRPAPANARGAQALWGVSLLFCGLFIGWRFVSLQIDFRPGAVSQSQPASAFEAQSALERYRAWRDVCAWIEEETDPQSRFLTPRNQQTFKWYAGRAEVVCWKDIPQDAAGIVQWWNVLQEIYTPAVSEGGLALGAIRSCRTSWIATRLTTSLSTATGRDAVWGGSKFIRNAIGPMRVMKSIGSTGAPHRSDSRDARIDRVVKRHHDRSPARPIAGTRCSATGPAAARARCAPADDG